MGASPLPGGLPAQALPSQPGPPPLKMTLRSGEGGEGAPCPFPADPSALLSSACAHAPGASPSSPWPPRASAQSLYPEPALPAQEWS